MSPSTVNLFKYCAVKKFSVTNLDQADVRFNTEVGFQLATRERYIGNHTEFCLFLLLFIQFLPEKFGCFVANFRGVMLQALDKKINLDSNLLIDVSLKMEFVAFVRKYTFTLKSFACWGKLHKELSD